jgi:hypothetical protein
MVDEIILGRSSYLKRTEYKGRGRVSYHPIATVRNRLPITAVKIQTHDVACRFSEFLSPYYRRSTCRQTFAKSRDNPRGRMGNGHGFSRALTGGARRCRLLMCRCASTCQHQARSTEMHEYQARLHRCSCIGPSSHAVCIDARPPRPLMRQCASCLRTPCLARARARGGGGWGADSAHRLPARAVADGTWVGGGVGGGGVVGGGHRRVCGGCPSAT